MSLLMTMVLLMKFISLEVEAVPRCKKYDDGRTFCTAGGVDFDLPEGFVSGDDAAKSITLRECRIRKLKTNSLKDLPMLEYLDLSGNKLTIIEENSISGLNNMKHLNLSYNMITKITGNLLFSEARNVEILDLRGNQLQNLETGIFSFIENLTYIDLSYNLLAGQALVDMFVENTVIRYLDLTGNNIQKMTDVFFTWAQSLEDLRLDECSLREVPNFRMKNLETIKYLSLSSNNLKAIPTIDTFIYLKSLETLNLAENNIDFIVDQAFLLTINLKTIILRKNRLQVIPEALFQSIPNLINVDLSNNLLEHLPVDTFRSTPVKKINLAGNRFTYLPLNFLSDLRNMKVNIENFYFHQNPWQCPCLIDIIAEVKKLRIEYNSAKYDGAEPVCVTGENFKCERRSNVNQVYTEMYDKAIKNYFTSLRH